jgi:putative phosphoribosyl transferase
MYMIFDSLTNRFHMKFKDRTSAAILLAKAVHDILKERKKKQVARKIKESELQNESKSDVLVIGIPRGGVVMADVISRKLSCEFDIVIPRKLGAPHNEELAIGAVVEDGTVYLNQDIISQLDISQEYIQKEKLEQIEEIKRRKRLYQDNIDSAVEVGVLSKITNLKKIKGKTVILVDDGIATGATIIAAARFLRRHQPKYLIVAAPVATKETRDLLKNEADEVEIITTPPNDKFQAVAQFYQDFKPVEDKQVMEILQERSSIRQG